MSIATSLQKIIDTKDAIRTSINNKGGSVTSGTPLSAYSDAIDALPGGGVTGNPAIVSMNVEDFTGTTFKDYRNYINEVRLDQTSITSLRGAVFEGCGMVKCLLPQGLTEIPERCFSQCTKLTGITIPSSVTKINESAFSGTTSLKEINVPQTVTTLGNRCFGSTNASAITIPNSISAIPNYCFHTSRNIKNLVFPASIKTIGKAALIFDYELETLTVMSVAPPTLLSDSFHLESKFKKIKVPCVSINAYKAATNWSQFASIIEGIDGECTGETKVFLTNSDGTYYTAECDATSAITSGEVSSQYSGTVNYIMIGDCVTTIGEGALKNCAGLTSVDIPSGVTTIGASAFEGCTGLSSIDLPSGVTTIAASAFEGCTGLGSLTIGSAITSIGAAAFSGCSSLARIAVEGDVPATLGAGAFDGSTCNIIVPSGAVEDYQAAWSEYASRIKTKGSYTPLTKIVKNATVGTGPFIVLDYIPTTGTSYRVEGVMSGGTGGMVFLGSYADNDNDDYRIFYNGSTAFFDWGSNRISTGKSSIPNEGFIGYNYGYKRLDGTVIKSGQTQSTIPQSAANISVQLFSSGSTDYGEITRIVIYENEVQVREYVAAIDNDVVGLYETMNGVFYAPTNGTLIGVE